jgi:hypothetical protein
MHAALFALVLCHVADNLIARGVINSAASNLTFFHNHPSFLGHEFMDDTYRGGNNFKRTLMGEI